MKNIMTAVCVGLLIVVLSQIAVYVFDSLKRRDIGSIAYAAGMFFGPIAAGVTWAVLEERKRK